MTIKLKDFKILALGLITLSMLCIFSTEAQAYSSDGTIVVRKKHYKSKSLLKKKFVYVHEAAGGGEISSASSGGSTASALSSPTKTDTGGLGGFSSNLKKAPRTPAKVVNTSSPSRASSGPAKIGYKGSGKSGDAKIGHKRTVNSGPAKVSKRGSNGSEAGDAVGSGTANMISENIHDEGNWDAFGEEVEMDESFSVNAKLLGSP